MRIEERWDPKFVTLFSKRLFEERENLDRELFEKIKEGVFKDLRQKHSARYECQEHTVAGNYHSSQIIYNKQS